jgi:hypothetical protein
MIAVYTENLTKPKQNGELLIGKAGGIYSHYSALNG